MKQPHELIELELFDSIDQDDKYEKDCCNIIVCKSYGALSWCCLAGANASKRCSYAEKIQILILNDSNPAAIYRPQKPSPDELY
jgi:hypothetical protein